ncbi:MAG: hypothetical protein QOE72_4671 [Chloroflexota bacterium]|jgi:chromosome segregation ATPase|nr:hypothetical protein [Chloroflexota bacterium]
MRLERLDVAGFGRLRDLRLDLAPRMTVLWGANEAGKSTVHRAVRVALYGIAAGGPGRAVERSDWVRWQPWDAGSYGLALTYALGDGRRYRVARRLEEREQVAQVQLIGGRDVTDRLRSGRLVLPGLVHLGIDEAVFCATACLGEDGLRPDAPDAAAQRADRLQEAIQRLADSASRATAAEALGRLRQAMDRVGTEGRSRSPLGAATTRLRRVEAELLRARERTDSTAREMERLATLERTAAAAAARRSECEREWLTGRLAVLGATRRALAIAQEEAGRLETLTETWRGFANFPVECEERVTALGGELRQLEEVAGQAQRRWNDARERIRAAERRRAEIATSIRALGRVPRLDRDDLEQARALAAEVAAEGAVARRAEELHTAEARAAGLRREIAATGLACIPPGDLDAVGPLIATASTGPQRRRLRPLQRGTGAVGALAALGALAASHGRVAGAILLAALGVIAVSLLVERFAGGTAQAARRQLSQRCPGLDLTEEGLRRATGRLPDLRRLHADRQRQELLVEAGRAELETATARIAELTGRCLQLAARIPVEVAAPGGPAELAAADGLLGRARQALAAVAAAEDAGRRRAELETEDAQLAREESAGRELRDEAERTAAARTELADELAGHLDDAGLPVEPDTARAVAAFRQGAATRRQFEAARDRLDEVRRRQTAMGAGDERALARQAAQLEKELSRRGGDPGAAAQAKPLDATALRHLEIAAERARDAAASALNEASGLRERLRGLLDSLPSIADLEDERAACMVVRERALRQLEALRRASALIEDSARRVHREVAPRLAASVAGRLALLTEGAYDEVHVDPERFAVRLHSRGRPDLIPVEHVSHGTRDQVGLLLRLALTEVLGEAGEPVPLLLDDPLLSSDPRRRRTAVEFLLRLSADTQVLLTTADPAVAEQVASSGVDGCTAVDLDEVTTRRGVRIA